MIQESTSNIRQALQDFELRDLFVEELGWEPHSDRRYMEVEGVHHELNAVAHKRGMVVYTLVTNASEKMPDSSTRRKIERKLAKHVLEHFIVYANADKTSQVWQWVKREPGSPAVTRELRFDGRPTESLIQRLRGIAFTLEEEDRIGLPDVWGRVQASFDVERVTRRFYDLFKKEHDVFLGFIQGLEDAEARQWYASIMLNRLMFVYFVQRKGFLDGNQNYLRDKLQQMQSDTVEGNFLTFYRRFLLRLFHEGLGKDENHRASEVDAIIGRVPYLNGGLFDVHELEESNPDLDIPDEAFERIFDFFDRYHWHLDEHPLRADNEINPDVLGYIFEKYINQKQMGAYYTQEDVTGYITQNSVIPYLFDAAREGCAVAFEPDSAMWSLLSENPDRYIYETVRKGVDEPLPEDIAAGVDNVSRRGRWNQQADEQHALPTETWREHVARRQRCEDLRSKLSGGEIHAIDDLVTLNLNIRQFAQDAIAHAEGPELVRAFYFALKELSVLDPTCGSGAFLFAALNVLETLYEACLERMQRFVEEDTSNERYTDFRRVLSEMEQHSSERYFILKSIMVNNLYGVDIMEEAVEIARLRLFLKLMAQVDNESEIEPLPDLDFNLRAGNTLVGFATLSEVQDALSSKLDLESSQERIQVKASEADDAFLIFRWMQVEEQADSEELRRAKADVREKLRELNEELDRYLASEYGVDTTDKKAFEVWRRSHQPFHWVVEFYGVIQSGGFAVIIGNPPWKEYSAVRRMYTVKGYSTERTGNLYALCIERSLNLSNDGGQVSFIVQLPMMNSRRMAATRRLLRDRSHSLTLIPFDDRPGKLFQGLEHCRSVIFRATVGSVQQDQTIHSSKYQRWPTAARETLFSQLELTSTPRELIYPERFAKLANTLHAAAFDKVRLKSDRTTASILTRQRSERFIFYQEAMQYWVKAAIGLPYYARDGEVGAPPHGRYLFLQDPQHAEILYALLNSSLFYCYFVAFSDCFHLSQELVYNFPITSGLLVDEDLATFGGRLFEDLNSNAGEETIQTRDGHSITYAEFYGWRSKKVTDNVDDILAHHYGLTSEELDFIINYDIKYRMGGV